MTFADKAISKILILVSLLCIILQGFITLGDGMKYVDISVDGELYGRYEFSKEVRTVNVKTEYGENTVKIDENYVWIEEASCPDKLDVKMGKIADEGQMIVCLPNRLLVKISGKREKVDKVTH